MDEIKLHFNEDVVKLVFSMIKQLRDHTGSDPKFIYLPDWIPDDVAISIIEATGLEVLLIPSDEFHVTHESLGYALPN